MVSLCNPSKRIPGHLSRDFAHLRVPKLLSRDQTAVNGLPKSLANERPLNRASLDSIKNRAERTGVRVAWPSH